MTRVNILRASAGSGKTFRLVLKYICDVLKKPECYCNILAITFTNKATEEMKSRIINELHKLADNQPSDYLEEIKKRTGFNEEKIRAQAIVARTKIIHDYSRFSVLTIDKFFQRILRAFINELSLDLDYNIELDTSMLLERSADDLINSISKENKAELKKQLEEFAKKRLDEGDKWDMRNDLRTLGKELFKDGIAKHVGSDLNKDEIDSVIKKLKEPRDNIKKLGKEGVDLLKAKGLSAGDFKGSNPSFITCFEKFMNGEFNEPTSPMRNAVVNIDAWYTKSKKNEKTEEVKAAAEELQPKLSEICKLYDENIHDINTLNLIEKNYQSYILLNDLYQSLMDICKKENIMILDNTKDILREFIKDVNAPFIYEKVGSRFDHHMIDEFQDTSKREWNNLKPLLHEALSSNEDASVFIVGDIKQSIFRWRGGNWELLNHDIIEDFKSHDPNVEPLELNRRSYENIVNFNNMLISNVVERDNEFVNGEINKERGKGITEAECDKLNNTINNAYNEFEQKVHHVGKQGIAEVTLFDSKTESPFIEAIKDAISRGYRYKDILILVRSAKRSEYNNKSDVEKVVEALCAYKETLIADNKPVFNILTSDSLKINSYDVVNFIIAVMRLAVNPYDNIERGIYNGYLKRSYGEVFNDDELATLSKIAHLSALEAFELIVKHFELHTNSKDVAYLQAVHELILSFSNNHIADIQHFLAWWDECGSDKTLSVEMSDDTIEITTIHKAKGLERDVVIIPYCKWSMTPKQSSIVWASANKTDKTLENISKYPIPYGPTMKNSAFSEKYWREFVMSHMDNINLLYVAVTRAKKELYMYVPTGKDYTNISGIIEEVLPKMDKMQHDEPIRNDDNKLMYQRYYYGEKIEHNTPKDDKQENGNFLLKDYPTHSTKVNIYKKLNRFTKEGSKPGTTACNMGIKMHKAFEGANTIDDLYESIEQMVDNGYIKHTEAESLRIDIEKATSNTLVAEWFSGEWDVVKCEEELLCQEGTIRPDRVMIKGDKVVVVDYKFGAVPDNDHHEQVAKYISALQNMGCYNTIEGYVWYVHLNKIEKSTQN